MQKWSESCDPLGRSVSRPMQLWRLLIQPVSGKANLNEFSGWKAYPRSASDAMGKGGTWGWSAVGGQTSSAYVEGGCEAGGNPLGSSSGSAVGVSAGFAAAALGTDTTGSVASRLNPS